MSHSIMYNMTSSAQNPHHHLPLPTPGAATAAPPPTPSTQPIISSNTIDPDFISLLLRRLPPTMSLSAPTRRSSPAAAPLISLSDPSPDLLSAATQFGYFHLTHHRIPAHLSSAATSLFDLPRHRKQTLFPQNFPLGHEAEDDDGAAESFCLDDSPAAADLDLGPLTEFSHEMKKLGLEVLDKLAGAAGFEKPAQTELRSLMWISGGANKPSRAYPYAVGIHYQIGCEKMSLWSDSGAVTVSGQPDSVFVTLGDIAQVWSNRKLKKVKGKPIPSSCDNAMNPHCLTMSLLITLPVESIVSPLVPNIVANDDDGEKRAFDSFSFEDYAWRVYHEDMPHGADSLSMYRV